jgi:N-acetylglucosaminyldiphosphoundecaprenol N-acetyl-beta-D-mannosaminyltransferase
MTITDSTDGYTLAGVPLATARFDAAMEHLLTGDLDGTADVHFVTAHTIVEASRDRQLAALLTDARISFPDGMPLVWSGRAVGEASHRVYGPDAMLALCDRGRRLGYRHYFYGGAEGTPELLAERLAARFPGMEVAGTYSPPFRPLTPQEDLEVCERINAAAPDFVWVGLGSPKQDYWVAEHRGRIRARALLAVGAAFDFHSGLVEEAPAWMRRTGLQWAHRLAQEPRRLWRRYTVVNATFLWLAGRSLTRHWARRIWSRSTPD